MEEHWSKPIERRLARIAEEYGEDSDEVWQEKVKIETEARAMLFKRPICRCPAVLHFVDKARHEAGEVFGITARSRCPFRGHGMFEVPERFLDLRVHGIIADGKSQLPKDSRPSFKGMANPLSSGFLFDTIDGRRDSDITIMLSADRVVEDAHFSLEGTAMPLDVYDKDKFWRYTLPTEPYDATDTSEVKKEK